MNKNKIIKVFLASSEELKDDRKEFEILINRENIRHKNEGVFFELVIWEDFIDCMSKTRLQDEYNKEVISSDIFISLFWTKVGKYTHEEFNEAYTHFQKNGKPLIYTYFKNAVVKPDVNTSSRTEFIEKLKAIGHFPTYYEDINDLKLQFKLQLDKLLPNFQIEEEKKVSKSYEEQNNLSIQQDKKPKVFISYSWDNETHKNWVLDLANKLTENGVYVFFDRYDLRAGRDMNHFMENSVRESDKVLLIMTPNYKIKAEKRTGGVGYEVSMVTAEIFNNQQSDKFIPIVRLGTRNICSPAFVKSKIDIDMSDDNKFDENFEELLRTIYNEHKIKRPKIGEKPNFTVPMKSEKLSNEDNRKPIFPPDYYFNTKEGQNFLRREFEELRNNKDVSNVEIIQKKDGTVSLTFTLNEKEYDVNYPLDFSKENPKPILVTINDIIYGRQ